LLLLPLALGSGVQETVQVQVQVQVQVLPTTTWLLQLSTRISVGSMRLKRYSFIEMHPIHSLHVVTPLAMPDTCVCVCVCVCVCSLLAFVLGVETRFSLQCCAKRRYRTAKEYQCVYQYEVAVLHSSSLAVALLTLRFDL
jgi:hypothetical protein